MAPVLHRAAGLVLSAPGQVPGLASIEAPAPADITFHPASVPSWARRDTPGSAPSPDHANLTLLHLADGVQIRYADGTLFWISRDATEIWCEWPCGAALSDACTYFASSVLGYALRMRGALALHASAVRIGATAWAFAGPHSAGKSTTAAALARRGHAIVCDDLLHLCAGSPGWLAQPYPGIVRLWPDGGKVLFGTAVELPAITAGWDKRYLETGRDLPYAEAPVPLGGVLFLQERAAGEPRLEPMSPAAALLALAANSASALLLDPAARAREFAALSDLVSAVRCCRLTASTDPRLLPRLLNVIEAWAAS